MNTSAVSAKLLSMLPILGPSIAQYETNTQSLVICIGQIGVLKLAAYIRMFGL